MIDFRSNHVQATNIADAWRQVMLLCWTNGIDYQIQTAVKDKEGGSYIGQFRKQLPYVYILIKEPYVRPYTLFTPPNIPPPTCQDKVEEVYFPQYIMGVTVAENEDYTYGNYIVPQIPEIISKLNTSVGNTNQAALSVGDPAAVHLLDPPCLRTITFNVVQGKLNMTVFFRSWDLFTGMPENLCGLQLLKEYILSELTFPVEDGAIVAYSSGLHLYSQYYDLAQSMNVNLDGTGITRIE